MSATKIQGTYFGMKTGIKKEINMSNTIWKVESAWDEFDNCPGQVLYFHKKENAEKCLREWLTIEAKIWEREGLDAACLRWPCKT
jgi:hypothetical protein